MSKKNKEAKIRQPKTVDYICNDSLYYQGTIIAKKMTPMKVTNNYNGFVDVVIEEDGRSSQYQVNEVTWKLWVKEVRVVKSPVQSGEVIV